MSRFVAEYDPATGAQTASRSPAPPVNVKPQPSGTRWLAGWFFLQVDDFRAAQYETG